ncbi:phosphate ABC transporter permease PstA [Streptomyces sp. SID3343]|uniref:phosphate ABC transporter permease PstA n=1 Tax=Streptomyces sp. SID3343 TaxID=2690260 RepID=UPI00136B1DDD|nr:phosphate ABC transporter permease PstA [Streptomyces sp. SID3343]MYV98803.1 phosphate ABC transporter permease PstA [Streptomyces sp. SID3343]
MTVTEPIVRPGPDAPPTAAVPQPPEERRVVLRRVAPDDIGIALGAAVAGASFAWLLYGRILPVSGWQGYLVTAYVSFLLLYAVATRMRLDRVAANDRVAGAVISTGAALMVGTVATVIGYVFVRGAGRVLDADFFTETQRHFSALSADGVAVGAAHAIVGTFEQMGIAIVLSVPLGMTAAIYMNEVGGRFAAIVRVVVEAMTAIPSVVAGLFVYAFFVISLGQGFCGLAAGLALSVEMMPVVTRATEVVLRLVPNGLREASLALGSGEFRTLWHVVLPTARSGLVTAVILGCARVVGETAPVLLVAGGSAGMNWNPFSGVQNSLPYFIWENYKSPSDELNSLAWGASVALLLIVLVLFVGARLIGGRVPGESKRRMRRPLAAAPKSLTPEPTS